MRNARLFKFLLALLVLTSSSLAFGSPTISLSPTSITADSGNCTNYPANQNITISNSGSGTLAVPTLSAIYGPGATGWLNMWVTGTSAPYTGTLQFQSLCGLANGTYTATVAVASSGASNTPVDVSVTLTIGSSSSPTITLSPYPTALSFRATTGGSNPASQNVTVSNSGSGTLAAPTTSINYGSGSGWLTVTESGSSGGPYTLKNQPATGSLAAGTYNATVSVASSGATNTPQTYTVAFTVAPPSPTISLSPTSITANSGNCTNYPANQTVTISNSGAGTLALPTLSATYGSGATGWLNMWVTGSSAPYTGNLQFQSLCGLANGTYTATVAVASSGASNTPVNLPVTLTIGSGSSPAISLSPTNLSFSAMPGGSNPASQNVTVSNSGGGTLAAPTTAITYGQGSGWLSVNCTGSSAPYTCSTQPATGSLAAGIYNATVKVSSSGASNSPQSYTVAFNVSQACTTSASNGTCGPYSDSNISASGTYPIITGQDVWNPDTGWSQTLYSTGVPGLFSTSSNERDWTKRSEGWRKARSIALNRL